MHPRRFALVGGILMLALGLLAFIPALSSDPASAGLPVLRVETSYGLFLGLFAMNVFNKVVFVVFGLAGIMASYAKGTSLPASISYSRWVFFVLAPLAILGMFEATNTLGGYWPLFGYNVLSAGLFAAVGAYFGFLLTSKVPESRLGGHPTRESLA